MSKDDRENGREALKKIMTEKFPVLMKDISPQFSKPSESKTGLR